LVFHVPGAQLDEASGTGGVLARYAAERVHAVLVTCTDGRCGDGPARLSLASRLDRRICSSLRS